MSASRQRPGQFATMWPATSGRRLRKVRHLAQLPDATPIALDVDGTSLAGLVTVDVEFPSESACEAFLPPAWFGREVTDDPRFKNRRLVVDGLPDGFVATWGVRLA